MIRQDPATEQAVLSPQTQLPMVQHLKDSLRYFDTATAIFEHQVLELRLPDSLFRYQTLDVALSDKTIQVYLEYDGKSLRYAIRVDELDSNAALPLIVADGIEPGCFTYSASPILSAQDAKQFVLFLIGYSRARVFRINTK